MFNPSRGGVRGGHDQFSWEDVKEDKHRENYLGHSVKAPVGRWQKGKDLHWYANQSSEAKVEQAERRAMEIKKIKQLEEDALAEALGYPVRDRLSGSNLEQLTQPNVKVELEREEEQKEGAQTETKVNKTKRAKKEKKRKKSKRYQDDEEEDKEMRSKGRRAENRRRDNSPNRSSLRERRRTSRSRSPPRYPIREAGRHRYPKDSSSSRHHRYDDDHDQSNYSTTPR